VIWLELVNADCAESRAAAQPGSRFAIDRQEAPLVAIDRCVVDGVDDIAIRVDCHVNGLMYLQVIVVSLADQPEVVDECEFGCPANDGKCIHFLGNADSVVLISSSFADAVSPLRLEMGFNVDPIVVDRYMLLDMENALDVHYLSRPIGGARDESLQCEWDEIVGR